MQRRRLTVFLAGWLAFAGVALPFSACAAPWAETGDPLLRHDLQRLSDAGVIDGVLGTWPVPWRSVANALRASTLKELDDPHLVQAARRVRGAALDALIRDGSAFTLTASASDSPSPLRGYADTPRGEGVVSASFENRSGIFAGRLKVTGVDDPPDDDEVRLDDSFISSRIGNWWAGVGALDRWWGPGNDGSLILSNNARPVPALFLDRASAEPFDSWLLDWLGPWRLSTFLGQLEDDRFVPNAKLFGMRFAFKPTSTLTIGLSRTAQFGGDRGRPEDLETFGRMLVGDDNQGETDLESEEPGNQLAGWDIRWAPDLFDIDTALYAQRIGEDFSDGIVTRQMTILGTEFAGGWGGGSWRTFFEFADTRSAGTDFLDATIEQRNISYNHGIYRDGYTFKRRVLGHTIDGDSKVFSVGGIFVSANGHAVDWVVRTGELNDDGGGRRADAGKRVIANDGAEIDSFRVGYTWPSNNFEPRIRVGADRISDLDGSDESTDGFAAFSLAYEF